MSRLGNRVALVTGEASGIGRASSILFAREGARVASLDRDAPGLDSLRGELSGEGLTSLLLACNVSESAQVDDAVARFVGEWREKCG